MLHLLSRILRADSKYLHVTQFVSTLLIVVERPNNVQPLLLLISLVFIFFVLTYNLEIINVFFIKYPLEGLRKQMLHIQQVINPCEVVPNQ